MATGIVKSFDYATGSGWITPEEGGAEVSVHFSAVTSKQRTLQEGQRVQFQISRDAAGSRATNVEILGATAAPTPSLGPIAPPNAAPRPAPSNPNNRRKTRAWPLGVAAVAGVLIALSSRRAPSPPALALATPTPTAGAVRLAPKLSAPAKAVVARPIVLEGEKFSQTRLRLLSQDEANLLTPDQLQYAISEMYARHGFEFRKRSKKQQFRRFSWYKPVKGRGETASWQGFSTLEKRNLQVLTQIRATRQAQQMEQVRLACAYQAEQQRAARQEQQDRLQQQQIAQDARAQSQPANSDFDEFETTPAVAPTPSEPVTQTPDFDSSGDFTATGKPIFTGPRGGRYHFSASGKKVYEKR